MAMRDATDCNGDDNVNENDRNGKGNDDNVSDNKGNVKENDRNGNDANIDSNGDAVSVVIVDPGIVDTSLYRNIHRVSTLGFFYPNR